MKIFQIFEGFCHWDATAQFPTLESTKGKFAPNIKFVEAPDFVFEQWGFNENAEGDARFIKPTPPEGWLYDDNTGCFYPNNPELIAEMEKLANPPEPNNAYGIDNDLYTQIENDIIDAYTEELIEGGIL